MWHWNSSIADKRWFMFTPHWNPSRWNKKKNFTDEQNVNRLRQGRQIHCILKAQDGDMMNILRSLGHINTEFQWSIINLCESLCHFVENPSQGACPTVLRDMCDLLILVEAAAM